MMEPHEAVENFDLSAAAARLNGNRMSEAYSLMAAGRGLAHLATFPLKIWAASSVFWHGE